jgi:hypothetical protein
MNNEPDDDLARGRSLDVPPPTGSPRSPQRDGSEHDDAEDDGDEDDGCWRCHGEGGFHDCGEDTCCCGSAAELINADWVWCPECNGRNR